MQLASYTVCKELPMHITFDVAIYYGWKSRKWISKKIALHYTSGVPFNHSDMHVINCYLILKF